MHSRVTGLRCTHRSLSCQLALQLKNVAEQMGAKTRRQSIIGLTHRTGTSAYIAAGAELESFRSRAAAPSLNPLFSWGGEADLWGLRWKEDGHVLSTCWSFMGLARAEGRCSHSRAGHSSFRQRSKRTNQRPWKDGE